MKGIARDVHLYLRPVVINWPVSSLEVERGGAYHFLPAMQCLYVRIMF